MDDDESLSEKDYIQTMDQREGVIDKEDFVGPYMAQMTKDAKNVTQQVVDLWNAGDPKTRAAVRDFEIASGSRAYMNNDEGRKLLEKSLSKDTLRRDTIWEIFIHAHQKYIASRLADEDNGPAPGSDEHSVLSDRYGFDMGGRSLFDFDKIRDKLKIPNAK